MMRLLDLALFACVHEGLESDPLAQAESRNSISSFAYETDKLGDEKS